jgi:hypothetical protein
MTGPVKARTPARRSARIALPLTLALALLGGAVRAETIVLDDQLSVRESNLERPGRV